MLKTQQKWRANSYNPTMFPWWRMAMGKRNGSTRALLPRSNNAIYNTELCNKSCRPWDVTPLETTVLINLVCKLSKQINIYVSFKVHSSVRNLTLSEVQHLATQWFVRSTVTCVRWVNLLNILLELKQHLVTCIRWLYYHSDGTGRVLPSTFILEILGSRIDFETSLTITFNIYADVDAAKLSLNKDCPVFWVGHTGKLYPNIYTVKLHILFMRMFCRSMSNTYNIYAIPKFNKRSIWFLLTHWGRDKMDAILQTTFSSAFSGMKIFGFRLKFHWSLFLMLQ